MKTPFERVLPRLKGLSNEEAVDVAIKILAQPVAKKLIIEEDVDYIYTIVGKLNDEVEKYIKDNAGMLAFAKVINRKEKNDNREKTIQQ